MKRLGFVLVSAALFALGTSMPAAADHGGDAHPLCADITASAGEYHTNGLVTYQLTLEGTSCRSVKYVVFIYDDPGDTEPLDRMVVHGDASDETVEFGTVDESGTATSGLDASADTDDNQVTVCALTIYRGKVADTGGFDATGACFGETLVKGGGVSGGGSGVN
jgi:hypothetical protein